MSTPPPPPFGSGTPQPPPPAYQPPAYQPPAPPQQGGFAQPGAYPQQGAYPQHQQQWQAAPVTERTSSPIAWLGVLAAIVCAVGSTLVWAKISFESGGITESIEIKGLGEADDRKDGVITLTLAIIAGVMLVLGALVRRKVFHILAAVAAGLAALTAFIDIADIESNAASGLEFLDPEVTIGIGLWLTAAGATVATICAIVAAVQTKKRVVDGAIAR
jgi:hypothetical protein